MTGGIRSCLSQVAVKGRACAKFRRQPARREALGQPSVPASPPCNVRPSSWATAATSCHWHASWASTCCKSWTPRTVLPLPPLLPSYVRCPCIAERQSVAEFFIDSDAEKLYFYPPKPLAQWGAGEELVISKNATCITVTNGSHLTLQGLKVVSATGTGISVSGVNSTVIKDCTVSLHGGAGIHLSGWESGVENCEVTAVGASGVTVTGGVVTTLTPGNNYVKGCNIHHYSLWMRTYQPGIGWGGVGNTYSGNYIGHAPHNAVLGGGGGGSVSCNCVFDGNVFDTVAYECSDTGAFYTGLSWVNRGNVLRNNVFKKIRNTTPFHLGAPSVQAIYLGAAYSASALFRTSRFSLFNLEVCSLAADDQMSGWEITNNTFIDSYVGMFIGGGRDNKLIGNHCPSTNYVSTLHRVRPPVPRAAKLDVF